MPVMPVSPVLINRARLVHFREISGKFQGISHFRETLLAAGTHGTREQNKEKTQAVQWWVGLLLKARVTWTNVVGKRNIEAALGSFSHGGPSNGPFRILWHWKGRPWVKEAHDLQKHCHQWSP